MPEVCGKPRDSKEYQRQYQKERRAVLKALGICTSCGKADAFKPKVLCADCLEKSALAAIMRLENETPEAAALRLARHRERDKKNYASLKEAGICVMCGRRRADEGRVRCAACRSTDNERRRLRHQEHRQKRST